MKTLTYPKHQMILDNLIERGGPEEAEYSALTRFINNLDQPYELEMFRRAFQPVLNLQTLYGHTYLKPFGYAGDYLLIEKIYRHYISPDPKWEKWDRHFHSHIGHQAVLNRKTYFIKTMEALCLQANRHVHVLILGSGPATDVHEFLLKNPQADISFDLLDIDQRAIDYATQKNSAFRDRTHFIKANVLRFTPMQKYDLIWSAGLFDYLNDRLFTGLVRRFKNFLTEQGEMVIGNFSPENPSRKCMEIMVEWILIHRSVPHLKSIATASGIPASCINVEQEPLGINLFLRIKPELQFVHPVIRNRKEQEIQMV